MINNQNFKAYCVTMKTTPERTAAAIEEFNKVGIEVEFFFAEKDSRGSKYGCWDSHIKIWNLAKNSNLDCIMVFEDDIVINESLETLQSIYNDALKAFEVDKELVYINLYDVSCPVDQIYGQIYTGCSPTNCAYIVNVKRAFEQKTCEQLEPDGLHFDYQLMFNKSSEAYVKNAVINPKRYIRQGKFDTMNDYGKIGNFLLKFFHHEKWANVTRIYANGLSVLPYPIKKKISVPLTTSIIEFFQ